MTNHGTIASYLCVPDLPDPLASRVFERVVDFKRRVNFTTRLADMKVEVVTYDKVTGELYSPSCPRKAKRPGAKPQNASGAKWKSTFHLAQESRLCLQRVAKEHTPEKAYGVILDEALRSVYPASYFKPEAEQ